MCKYPAGVHKSTTIDSNRTTAQPHNRHVVSEERYACFTREQSLVSRHARPPLPCGPRRHNLPTKTITKTTKQQKTENKILNTHHEHRRQQPVRRLQHQCSRRPRAQQALIYQKLDAAGSADCYVATAPQRPGILCNGNPSDERRHRETWNTRPKPSQGILANVCARPGINCNNGAKAWSKGAGWERGGAREGRLG